VQTNKQELKNNKKQISAEPSPIVSQIYW